MKPILSISMPQPDTDRKAAVLRTIMLPSLLGLALTLMGCIVTSVHPFYAENDVIYDPALAAVWVEVDAKGEPDSWTFEKAGEKKYKLTIAEQNNRTEYDARLFKMKDQLFLDFLPIERRDGFVPVHSLLRVTQIEPTLKMAVFSSEWLEEFLSTNPAAIRHAMVPKPDDATKHEIVLTAETKDLQEFVHRHLNDEGAFKKADEMKRRENKK